MAPLVIAGLSLLPKLPELWGAIAGLFGKKVPDTVEAAGKLAGEIMEGIEKGQVSTAEQMQLKSMLYAHEERIIELQNEETARYLQDRQNARQADVDKTKATGSRDFNLYFLAWVNVGGFFAVLVAVIICDMPTTEVAKTALAMLFGALITGYKDVLGYFFGSSKSSADKTTLLANGGKQ